MTKSKTTLRICGQSVQVKYEDPRNWSAGGMGRCSVLDGEILINKKMPQTTKDSTLLHEIVHFILDSHAIELDEISVNTIAISLHNFLRDNPGLVEEISKPKA